MVGVARQAVGAAALVASGKVGAHGTVGTGPAAVQALVDVCDGRGKGLIKGAMKTKHKLGSLKGLFCTSNTTNCIANVKQITEIQWRLSLAKVAQPLSGSFSTTSQSLVCAIGDQKT